MGHTGNANATGNWQLATEQRGIDTIKRNSLFVSVELNEKSVIRNQMK